MALPRSLRLALAALALAATGCTNDAVKACETDETCGADSWCVQGACRACPTCAAGQVCLRGECVPATCGRKPCRAGEGCVDGECRALDCAGVSCPAGQGCAKGQCYPVDCAGAECHPGLVCWLQACSEPSCVEKSCGTNERCAAGKCYPASCGTEACAQGAVCVEGKCLAAACVDRTCPAQTVCADGECVADRCGSTPCEAGFGCVAGACVDLLCQGVVCGGQTRCERGACRTCPPTETACGDGADDDCDGKADCADEDCQAQTCGSGSVCSNKACAPGCAVDGQAWAPDAANPANPCQACAPATSSETWTPRPDGEPCALGRICRSGACSEACFLGGKAYAQDAPHPTNPCLACLPLESVGQWSPQPAGHACGPGQVCDMGACISGCIIANVLYPNGAVNPENPCQACRTQQSTSAWTDLGDGLVCDTGRICHGGQCTAGCLVEGTFRAEASADPANPCQTCQPRASSWSFTSVANGTGCGAGRVCAFGACQQGCWVGTYYPDGSFNPASVCQRCNAAQATTAWTNEPEGLACGSSGWQCHGGACTQSCVIGGASYLSGDPNPANPCQVCRPTSSTTAWSTATGGTACGNGSVCDGTTCKPGCWISGSYRAASAPNPSNACQTCQPATSTTTWTASTNGSACGTGRVCNAGTCSSGCFIGGAFRAPGAEDPANACRFCQPATSTTGYTAGSGVGTCPAGQVCSAGSCQAGCYLGSAFVAPGTANPTNSCQACTPGASTTAWTNVAGGTLCATGVCQAGSCQNGCWIDGAFRSPTAANPSNACETCVPGTSKTAWTPLAAGAPCGTGRVCAANTCTRGCWIGSAFYAEDTPNPMNPCQSCQPSSSTTAWRAIANGTVCGTGQICYSGSCGATCWINSTHYTGNANNPANACQSCQPAASNTGWSNRPDGTTACTGGLCMAGSCSRWAWENPRPTGNRLYAVWPSSATEAWAGGTLGALVRWNGTAWSDGAAPKRAELRAFWGYSPGDLWLAGNHDIDTWQWDGANWSVRTGCHPYFGNLNGLWGSAPFDLWAVGQTTCHWNGSAWSTSTSTGLTAEAAWGTSASDVWAVGPAASGRNASHWDGTSWTTVATGTSVVLKGVWAASSDDVWAVGASGTIVRRTGGAWATVPSGTTSQLNGVWGTGANDVWAVGAGGTLLRWNGSTWSQVPSGTTLELLAIRGRAANDVWVAGEYGTLLHWDGTSWSPATPFVLRENLRAAWGTSTANLWAVGENGAILRWTATGWTRATSPTSAHLNALAGAGPNLAFAAGSGGALVRWNGTAWASAPSGTPNDLHGLWLGSAASGWAVGASGTAQRFEGSTWASSTTGTSVRLNGVWGASATDVWAVGQGGTMLHHDGSSWSALAPQTTSELFAVTGTSASEAWAVGAGGAVLRFNGSTWTNVAGAPSVDLRAAWSPGPGRLWAVGESGTRHFWNGSWVNANAFSLGVETANAFAGLAGLSSNDLWVVGVAGSTVHLGP